jgi:hypothetical protein
LEGEIYNFEKEFTWMRGSWNSKLTTLKAKKPNLLRFHNHAYISSYLLDPPPFGKILESVQNHNSPLGWYFG